MKKKKPKKTHNKKETKKRCKKGETSARSPSNTSPKSDEKKSDQHTNKTAHKVATELTPVHPKGNMDLERKCDAIYEIPCLSCNKTYIGEKGRMFAQEKKNRIMEAYSCMVNLMI